MQKVTLVIRIVLGLMLLIFGLNKFMGFMEMPEMPEAAGSFMGALVQSGYMMPLIGLTEIVTGALLLSGFFVPLAAVLLAPLSLNIILFHLALAPAAIVPGLIVFVLNLYLLFAFKPAYSALLQPKYAGGGAPPASGGAV